MWRKRTSGAIQMTCEVLLRVITIWRRCFNACWEARKAELGVRDVSYWASYSSVAKCFSVWNANRNSIHLYIEVCDTHYLEMIEIISTFQYFSHINVILLYLVYRYYNALCSSEMRDRLFSLRFPPFHLPTLSLPPPLSLSLFKHLC